MLPSEPPDSKSIGQRIFGPCYSSTSSPHAWGTVPTGIIVFILSQIISLQSAQAQLVWTIVPAPGHLKSASAGSHSTPVADLVVPAHTSFTQTPTFSQPSTLRRLTTSSKTPRQPENAELAQARSTTTPQPQDQPALAGLDPSRRALLIAPLVSRLKPWPAPSLSPGVPSGFIAGWGDVFLGASAATPGKTRDGVIDGSWVGGFGLGDAAKFLSLELSGGCGSIKNFCGNGSFDAKLGRLLLNQSNARLGAAVAWQSILQWGYEGRQDNTYYGVISYALPLRSGRSFGQTLQFNLGAGNSRYAPFTSENSQDKWGLFASAGVELTRYAGFSTGWSGRGVNAQISLTPFRNMPISINFLGADLFNQTPAGTVGILSLSWGTNFRTASF